MIKLYGQVKGMGDTTASRRGSDSIRVSAQSHEGSVITELEYNHGGELEVTISISNESSMYGTVKWHGSFADFVAQLEK